MTYPTGELVPGTVYRVVRHIATGGMGTVYDVEDTTIGKRYVLKTLLPMLGDRKDLARRIAVEARTLASLHHPNIVEVFTAGVTADELRLPFFVMERLNGQTLRTVLEKKKCLDLAHAYRIAIDLLDALDHAHEKGVVHRDVKPDNIFLHRTANGATVTKLLDFGILRFMGQTREANDTGGRFLGTLRYASPEQLRGDDVTTQSDLYASGLVLFEMIAGSGPFDSEGDVQRIGRAHLKKEPPRLSSKITVPEALDDLVASALSKDPERRPRDAFAFAAELRRLKKALSDRPPESGRTREAVLSPDDSQRTLVDEASMASSAPGSARALGELVESGESKPSSGEGGAQGHEPVARSSKAPSAPEVALVTEAEQAKVDAHRAESGSVDRGAATRSAVYAEDRVPSADGTLVVSEGERSQVGRAGQQVTSGPVWGAAGGELDEARRAEADRILVPQGARWIGLVLGAAAVLGVLAAWGYRGGGLGRKAPREIPSERPAEVSERGPASSPPAAASSREGSAPSAAMGASSERPASPSPSASGSAGALGEAKVPPPSNARPKVHAVPTTRKAPTAAPVHRLPSSGL